MEEKKDQDERNGRGQAATEKGKRKKDFCEEIVNSEDCEVRQALADYTSRRAEDRGRAREVGPGGMNITMRGRGSQARQCENGMGREGEGAKRGEKTRSGTKWRRPAPQGAWRHGAEIHSKDPESEEMSRNGNKGEQSGKKREEKWVVCGWVQNDVFELAEYVAFY